MTTAEARWWGHSEALLEEIAKAALFLASDNSSFVDGAEILADGGQAQV